MPDYIATTTASAICTHGATVSIVSSNTRVKGGGAPLATISDTYTVVRYPFRIQVSTGTKPQPCLTLRWIAPALRVRVDGRPVVLQSSSGICLSGDQTPQGPATVVTTQIRVKGA